MSSGKVYIIGAGPGSYKLMTLKALECIRKSEMIVYDRLIDEKVLGFASDNAGFVYVGKKAGLHPVPQEEINEILLKSALEGKTVARVKGGDPFLFGRGGEECEFLHNHGVEFEVVPGITSAIAVPAYAGIPVTHRDFASALHIIAGHKGENSREELDFETLAKLKGTLVFLMGIKNIGMICSQLIHHGKPIEIPAAIIENGAGAGQRVLTGTVNTIAEKAAVAGVKSPAVIVIGEVARLTEKLSWYGKGPLHGKKILVTRPIGQSEKLVEGLEELGAKVLEFPVIRIVETEDYIPLQKALECIHEYNWMVFTSSNGVHKFFKQLNKLRKDIRLLAGLKLAVVGPATAASLCSHGVFPDYMPDSYTTRDLLKGLVKLVEQKGKVLLLRSEIASDELAEGLRKNGISFDDIAVYKTETNLAGTMQVPDFFTGNGIDFITLASPSSADALVSIAGRQILEDAGAGIVCIGPVTAAAVRKLGFEVAGVADEYTDEGMINKLIELVEGEIYYGTVKET